MGWRLLFRTWQHLCSASTDNEQCNAACKMHVVGCTTGWVYHRMLLRCIWVSGACTCSKQCSEARHQNVSRQQAGYRCKQCSVVLTVKPVQTLMVLPCYQCVPSFRCLLHACAKVLVVILSLIHTTIIPRKQWLLVCVKRRLSTKQRY